MTKARRRFFWLAIALVIAMPLSFWLYRQIEIDKCLDGGGAWDYEQAHCIHEVAPTK